jgi:hypothetical protein
MSLTDHRRTILLGVPPVLLATTVVAFRGLTHWLGLMPGYLAGFLFYWLVWCVAVPLAVLGRAGLTSLWRPATPALGRPQWVGLVAVVLPLALGIATRFPERSPLHHRPLSSHRPYWLSLMRRSSCCGAVATEPCLARQRGLRVFIPHLVPEFGISRRSPSFPIVLPAVPGPSWRHPAQWDCCGDRSCCGQARFESPAWFTRRSTSPGLVVESISHEQSD